jgi:uncharacterized protein YodC (DUF2158 family)
MDTTQAAGSIPFQPGDVVQLKSGGPAMTVDCIQEDGTLWCIWFADKANQSDAFHPHLLKKTGAAK